MVHQFGDIGHQPLQGQLVVGGRHRRIAVAAQIHPHHAVMPAERRDPGVIAFCAAHRRVQQQQNRYVLPGLCEIVDVKSEPQPVACLEGFHRDLRDFVTALSVPRR